jgi:hypothetical protein
MGWLQDPDASGLPMQRHGDRPQWRGSLLVGHRRGRPNPKPHLLTSGMTRVPPACRNVECPICGLAWRDEPGIHICTVVFTSIIYSTGVGSLGVQHA